jgi:hypothetical protein
VEPVRGEVVGEYGVAPRAEVLPNEAAHGPRALSVVFLGAFAFFVVVVVVAFVPRSRGLLLEPRNKGPLLLFRRTRYENKYKIIRVIS